MWPSSSAANARPRPPDGGTGPLPQVLAARLTTSVKPAIPSIVELGDHEVVTGRVVCDDIVEIYEDEVRALRGALSATAMRGVGRGLAAALDLPVP